MKIELLTGVQADVPCVDQEGRNDVERQIRRLTDEYNTLVAVRLHVIFITDMCVSCLE